MKEPIAQDVLFNDEDYLDEKVISAVTGNSNCDCSNCDCNGGGKLSDYDSNKMPASSGPESAE